MGGAGAHPVGQAAVLERGGNLVLGEANLDRHLAKDFWVADVARFLPVGVASTGRAWDGGVPRSRASSVRESARIVFGTTSGGGL